MLKLSQGKIKLEDKLLDLATFEVRPKATEQDLERYYDSFIEHVGELKEYFENKDAFDKVIEDAADEKRPKLIPREPKYPSMFVFTPFRPFDPSRRLGDNYFVAGSCITKIPTKIGVQEKPPDEKLQEDIKEKFKQYPGYEGIIEIPNDRTPQETKSTIFHEALHYAILRYHVETEKNFVNVFIRENLSPLKKYQYEKAIDEHVVEILTDKLLTHDPDAQFENRWSHYSFNNGFRYLAMVSALATGLILGTSISKPYLLPLALVPGRIRNYAVNKYKQSKREEILKSIEYPTFKI